MRSNENAETLVSALLYLHMGVSKNRGSQNGRFFMENPIKMDALGVPLFLATPISINIYHISGQFMK